MSIIVGLSGGVDSSVAALLLLEQGYEVEGLFMKNWEEDDDDEYCAAAEDLADAQAVADRLGIKLHSVNFASEYWDGVFEHFLNEYRALRTPNPDVLCNREIKFKAFLDYALDLGADSIATGHYAHVGHNADRFTLERGLDNNKDQSYFLYLLGQRALQHSQFPLGKLTKPEVRQLAEKAGFPNHKKKDSTGICFIGERRFKEFLSRYIPAQPGPMLTPDGQRVGEHHGLMFYTYGQRQGLHIGGVKGAADAPWFVVDKQVADNALIVAQDHQHPLMMHSILLADQAHWVAEVEPNLPLRCRAKIRYRQPDQDCTVQANDQGLRVTFDTPQRAITPGQSIVFYQNQICLGGAIIANRL